MSRLQWIETFFFFSTLFIPYDYGSFIPDLVVD